MRTLRYLVLALLFLILVVVVIGFFLPAKVQMQRSIEINRDKAVIFQVINSLNNFNKWSPWFQEDINAKYILSGAKEGVGSKLSWQGNNKVGKGSNEIIESELNAYVKTMFYFGKSDYPAYSTLTLEENTDSANTQTTIVTWTFENDFGYNIFYRYFGFVLEDMIAPAYEKGLSNLKTHVESLPLHDYSNVSIIDVVSEKTYIIESKTSMKQEDITSAIATAYGKLMVFINRNNILMKGTPKIISLKVGEGAYHFLAAIPVEDNLLIDEMGEIKWHSTYQGKAIKIMHKGSYKHFKKTYDILAAYLQQNNLQQNGYSWEDFVTDPAKVSEENLITYVYQPIK